MNELVCGVVLAAGAGSRFGSPKALAHTVGGQAWIARAVEALRGGGCADVVVVLGAAARDASALVPAGTEIVIAEQWTDGVSASLRAGLEYAATTDAAAVVVVPVDTPDLPDAAVARIIAAAGDRSDALVQSVYAGAPGHPVLIGRNHWDAVAAGLAGDRGARSYLAANGADEIDCIDLWSGADIDSPFGLTPAGE